MSRLIIFVVVLSMIALLSAVVGSVGMSVAAAAPAGQSTLPADVLQTEWTLQYMNTDARAAGQDVTASKITIKFAADGTLGGSGGCNSYSGSYTVNGQQMTIGDNLISTMMACEESVMNNEQVYLRNLTTVNGYALVEGKLDLIYADAHNAMTYIPGASQGGTQGLAPEVLQTEWILRYFNSNDRDDRDVATDGLSIQFAADGTLGGFAGCNNYSGSYTVSGQQMTIGENLITTRKACPEGPMALESRYLGLLPTVKSYTATTRELQLVYGENGDALVYIPRANAPQVEPPIAPVEPVEPVEPVAPSTPSEPGMPRTGGGTPPIFLIVLVGALAVLGTGFALRAGRAGEGARRRR